MVELTREMADQIQRASEILQALAEGMQENQYNAPFADTVDKLQSDLRSYAAKVPEAPGPLPRPRRLQETDNRFMAVGEYKNEMRDLFRGRP